MTQFQARGVAFDFAANSDKITDDTGLDEFMNYIASFPKNSHLDVVVRLKSKGQDKNLTLNRYYAIVHRISEKKTDRVLSGIDVIITKDGTEVRGGSMGFPACANDYCLNYDSSKSSCNTITVVASENIVKDYKGCGGRVYDDP